MALINIGMPSCPFCGSQMKADKNEAGDLAIGCWGAGDCWYFMMAANETSEKGLHNDEPHQIRSVKLALEISSRRAK